MSDTDGKPEVRMAANSDVGPGDSVSQCGNSVASSTSSSRARRNAAAKRAALLAEASVLREQQELETQQLKLKQQMSQLKLKAQIASAEAEEKVFAEFEEKILYEDHIPCPVDIQTPVVERKSTIQQHDGSVRSTRSPDQDTPQPDQSSPSANGLSAPLQVMVDMMQLPKAELMTFDGDPLQFWEFWRAFQVNVDDTSISDAAKLTRLLHYCRSDARKVIQACSAMSPDEGYARAKVLLQQRFGNRHKVADSWIRKVTHGNIVPPHNGPALRSMADELQVCYETLVAMGHESEMNFQTFLVQIVERLPMYLRYRWIRKTKDIFKNENRQPSMADMVSFVDDAADEENDPVYGPVAWKDKKDRQPQHRQAQGRKPWSQRSSSHSANTDKVISKTNSRRCYLCHEGHTLFGCQRFKQMKPMERVDFAKKAGLCFNCLNKGHMTKDCSLNRLCSVDGCKMKHTKFLHIVRTPQEQKGSPQQTRSVQSSSQSQSESLPEVHLDAQSHATGAGQFKIALPIVPVRVYGPEGNHAVDTFALLDSGSTNSFCTKDLTRRLGVSGRKQTLSLSTLDQANSQLQCTEVSLRVKGQMSNELIDLPSVYTKESINVSCDKILKEDITRWPHLEGLDILHSSSIQKVELLIGQDAPEALAPIEVRRGHDGPYAIRTKLGWTLNGPAGRKELSKPKASANFINSDVCLEEQVHKFWMMEGNDMLEDRGMSINDQKTIRIWEETVTKDQGHYQLAIPFKEQPPDLENNKYMADQRLKSLGRRLEKDRDLHEKYKEGIKDLLDKGYAEEVKDDAPEPVGATWYIPHHPVFHPMKEKMRIVFDCAGKYKGTSLNDAVMQGPDLTNKLIGVLLRFRQAPIALMADIEAMFYQVKVPPAERDSLRFLWWPDGNLQAAPKIYRMCVHLFGGSWSPSVCSYALRQTALDTHEDDSRSEARKAILNNFYVDDCLVSVEDVNTATKLAADLMTLLKEGGFRLTKWVSNTPTVLESIPEDERAKDVKGLDLNLDALPVERALGMTWNVELDCFVYKFSPKIKPMTRRGILSVLSSVYDPVGYASPFTLRAKLILQELTRNRLGWDEEIPLFQMQQWTDWLRDLPNMEEFQVNRCLKPYNFGQVMDYELHHFSDASELSYGAASYLVMKNTEGHTHSSLIFAKSHLAPLKKVTIPRLELTAATLSVRLDVMLRRELEFPISRSVFWTDSTIVLQYVRNEDKRFKTFVANRIATIRENSEPAQWHYVDSASNPADDTTRSMGAEKLKTNTRWLTGPEFICLDERCWPQDPTLSYPIKDDDPEVKAVRGTQAFAIDTEQHNAVDKLLSHFSSWFRLQRAVAWILRCRQYLRSKVQGNTCDVKKPLNTTDMNTAEEAIVRYIQRQAFPNEYKVFQENAESENGKRVLKSSPLSKLDIKFTEKGLMCVGGRLDNAPLKEEMKHPMVLPPKHHVIDLLVRHHHNISGHSGKEYVLSMLRNKYWIVKGRSAVRRVLLDCFTCKRLRANPVDQKMADLPVDRVTPEKPPFSHVGVDCFGPYFVKQGRSQVKRYGCIFTCLVIRAVHIEILHSMETDSFLNALQRFISRRGKPDVIRCDNGTNFVGAERELKEGLQKWNQTKIHDYLLQKGVDWKFNPPSAPHMGGVWERLIRTTKKVLSAVMKQQVLTDEGLSTLLCLVESIINGRPLTVISDDTRDPEPLTPNHLLLLRQSNILPPDVFGSHDLYSRRRWRQVQYLADLFWRRWIREYLPSLQCRQKWLKEKKNLKVGDIVLIVEDLPRNKWLMGRISEAFPGKDQLVRCVKVKHSTGTLTRPVHKVCLLEEVGNV